MSPSPPLLAGTLIRRYQRFLADITLADGSTVTAHCPNSGSMLGLQEPGSPVRLSLAANPRRKLPLTWEQVRVNDTWVAINTNRTNQVVRQALEAGSIAALADYREIRAEVFFDTHSRLDFRLAAPDGSLCWLEVKCVTLAQGEAAQFPDAVTQRGHPASAGPAAGGGGGAPGSVIIRRSAGRLPHHATGLVH